MGCPLCGSAYYVVAGTVRRSELYDDFCREPKCPIAAAYTPRPRKENSMEPIEFTGVKIQESGQIPLPTGISLNAMTDVDEKTCTFTMISFAATELEARTNLDQFLTELIKAITP